MLLLHRGMVYDGQSHTGNPKCMITDVQVVNLPRHSGRAQFVWIYIQEELADQMNFGVRCIDSAARSDFCVLRSNALHNGMKFQRVAIATPWKFIIIVSMFVFAEKFICTTEWIEVS